MLPQSSLLFKHVETAEVRSTKVALIGIVMLCISLRRLSNHDPLYPLASLDPVPCSICPRPNPNLVGAPAYLLHTWPLQWGANSERCWQTPKFYPLPHYFQSGNGRGEEDVWYLSWNYQFVLRESTLLSSYPPACDAFRILGLKMLDTSTLNLE